MGGMTIRLVGLLLFGLLFPFVGTACSQDTPLPTERPRPEAPSPAGAPLTGYTPNHWRLSPAGTQIVVGDRPMGMALDQTGRYLFITNNGQGVQSLVVFDTLAGGIVEKKPYPPPEALFFGIAVSPDNARVYASAGGNNKIRVYAFEPPGLTELDPIILGGEKDWLYPSGLAMAKDGQTLYAALNLANALAKVNLKTKEIQRLSLGPPASQNATGPLPYQLALSKDGKDLYVSLQNEGDIAVVDLERFQERARIKTGRHPSALALSHDGQRLYVANTNADTLTVIDTASQESKATINLSPYPGAPFGSMPNALALSGDDGTLFVSNGGNNDIALVDTKTLTVKGLIPTAWFPSALALSKDGKTLYVTNMKGLGAGPNPKGPNPESSKPYEQYIGSMIQGTLSAVKVPDEEMLKRYTERVTQNNGFDETKNQLARGSKKAPPHSIPRRPGEPSFIRHVIYVIKENRTYDQVLGDMPQGNGDPSLVLFGPDTTPNHHALAKEFVLFDNFYADAEVSADGHNWSMGAIATDYVQRNWPANYSGRNRPYDFEAGSEAVLPPAGYLWDLAQRAGLSYRVYGEFGNAGASGKTEPAAFATNLEGHIAPDFPAYNLRITDQTRFEAWEKEFEGFVKKGVLPSLMIVRLPNDHTAGTRPGMPTPKAMVADNDLALGRLIEAVSRSPFWVDTAVFVVEDDAQNGPDHVDAHRTLCLIASPYARRGVIDSIWYSTVSLIKTIELILGLPSMSQFDAAATPMLNAFTDEPDTRPYLARIPTQPLSEINGEDAFRAKDSLALNLDQEADRMDEQAFNEILWGATKGPDTAMPKPRHAYCRPTRPG
ncbi:MAG: bifunctional YncE family protein/alkaline phosphatase family protein [Nitrospirota bacterium]|nr:bifunctional YncE family protein/alkaline phosphatase family protein [Nitrospirota bacterium]